MRISKSRLTTQTFSHFVSLACLLFAIASYIFSHLFILFHFFSPSVRGQCKCTCECLCVGLTATYAAHAHCAVRVRTAGSAGPSSVALLCLPPVCQTITTTTAECPDSKKKNDPSRHSLQLTWSVSSTGLCRKLSALCQYHTGVHLMWSEFRWGTTITS